MRSIVRRVLSTVLLAQIVLVVCIISMLLLHERFTRLRALDARLQGRADSLAGAIQDSEDAAADVFVDPREFKAPSADRYAVYGENGRLIFESAPDSEGLLMRRGLTGFRDAAERGKLYRIREQPGLRIVDRAETHGVGLQRPITIVYATPQAWVRHELAEATRFYIVAGAFATALVSVLLTWSLRKSLSPINELASAAAAIPARPVLQFSPPTSVLEVRELSVLASSLESVVDRVRLAFSKEQQFVSDAAHELKTAVAVIRSGVQVLLIRTRDPLDYESGLQRLLEDMDRLEGVVLQMLQSADISESPAGNESCDLFAVVERAVVQLKSMSAERGVAMRILGQSGGMVSLSAARALVLVENLLVNALQHSAASSDVTVSVEQNQSTLNLTVADHGSGIHPDALPHVFERFYREDRSRSRKTGGSGLGLAICKAIVEGVGGKISIESELDLGTTVRATFISS